jgi:hypothetical protein
MCFEIAIIWLSVIPLAARVRFFSEDLHQWFKSNIQNNVAWNNGVAWKDFWATVCHRVWMWLNKELHDDTFQRPHHPIHQILRDSNDYYSANLINRSITGSGWETQWICWKPLIVGRVKLNTDGACKVGGGAGCGGLIRGSDGQWLGGFAKNVGRCSAYVAYFGVF